MPGRTADDLVEACMLDTFPHMAASVDFGLDQAAPEITKDNCVERMNAYKQAVRSGKVTADQLHKAVGDGPELSKLVGITIWTMWDVLDGRYAFPNDTVHASVEETETN